MAMPSYVGAINTVVVSTITRTWPAGHTTNDVAFFIGQGTAATGGWPATPGPNEAGWTEIPLADGDQTSGNVAFVDVRIRLWWKRIPGPSQPSLSIQTNGAGNGWATVLVVRGLPTTGDVWNKIKTLVVNTATTSMVVPAITTSKPDCFILSYIASSTNSASAQYSAFTSSSLANVANRLNTSNTTGHQVYVNTGEKALQGDVVAGSATSATSNKYISLVIAAGEPGPSAAAIKAIARRRRIRSRF